MAKGKRGSGFGTTLALALVIVVLSIAVGVGLARYVDRVPLLGSLFGEEAKTTSPTVVEGIQRLDRLATVRWTESVVVTKESDGSSLERFLIGERVILVAVGEVEAGVDLANMTSEDVQVNEDKVTIRLPEPEILSTNLDEERTSVYDRDQGLLRLRPDDALVEGARRDAEEEITATAQENGILDHARERRREYSGLRRVPRVRGGRVHKVVAEVFLASPKPVSSWAGQSLRL